MNARRRLKAPRSIWMDTRPPKLSHYPYYPYYIYDPYDYDTVYDDYGYDDDGYEYGSTWINQEPRSRSSWINQEPKTRSSWITEKAAKKRKSKAKRSQYIVLDVPLMLALLEYAKDEAGSDKKLHEMVEEMLEMIDEYGPLDMNCYDYIVGEEEEEELYAKTKSKAVVTPPPAPPAE